VRPAEVPLAQVRLEEGRSAEVRPTEARLAEVRPEEVRIAEIWLSLRIVLPPLIPRPRLLP